jgi:hypothetical protein
MGIGISQAEEEDLTYEQAKQFVLQLVTICSYCGAVYRIQLISDVDWCVSVDQLECDCAVDPIPI